MHPRDVTVTVDASTSPSARRSPAKIHARSPMASPSPRGDAFFSSKRRSLFTVFASASACLSMSFIVSSRHSGLSEEALLHHVLPPSPNAAGAVGSSVDLGPTANGRNLTANPYYLQGRHIGELGGLMKGESRRDFLRRLVAIPARPFPPEPQGGKNGVISMSTWVLRRPLPHATRNQDSVFIGDDDDDDGMKVVTALGRYSRHVQWIDLMTGKSGSRQAKGVDPAGRRLDDLNHVAAVLVDAIPKTGGGDAKRRKEIWIPCGFHGDAVNSEISSEYARIVDVDTLKVRVGPQLPNSGGACVATALSIVPDEPPMICSFAGTRGSHDKGTFLPQTACYDRERERWWDPFGNLPYGLDHANLVVVPPGTCHRDDPARILILNFRTRPYGDCHPEIWAYDLPERGWTLEQLEELSKNGERRGEWSLYHNTTDLDLPQNVPRDASGVVVVNNGRHILNFGGTAHRIDSQGKRVRVRFSMIRALDVCEKEWSIVGDMGLPTFALQSAASERLQVAFTCGGEAPLRDSVNRLCFVSRWDRGSGMTIDNQHAIFPFSKASSTEGNPRLKTAVY